MLEYPKIAVSRNSNPPTPDKLDNFSLKSHEIRTIRLPRPLPVIKAFGAPIDPADAKTIGDYLKENYGR